MKTVHNNNIKITRNLHKAQYKPFIELAITSKWPFINYQTLPRRLQMHTSTLMAYDKLFSPLCE